MAYILILFALLTGCKDDDISYRIPEYDPVENSLRVETDKARYNPGETVSFTLENPAGRDLKVRYRHLGSVVSQEKVSGTSWMWAPPSEDFKGYLVELVEVTAEGEAVVATTAVDVSSDWTRFPRYGFISDYAYKTEVELESVIRNLNRHHINGMQYYDWLWDHHIPLAGTPEDPAESWPDLMNKINYRSTVQGYIDLGRRYGIASMFYDLCFGVLDTWEADGVRPEWMVYTSRTDNSVSKIDMHDAGDVFRSVIYLADPANDGWLDYFSPRIADVYKVYDFDGFHIDQLGNRGTRYDYNKSTLNLRTGYQKFLERMHADFPDKKHSFNAVSRWGQSNIAAGGVDFFYNEIWKEGSTFSHLKDIVDENKSYDASLNCVFAMYMNYDLSGVEGVFNTPGVLLADACVMALGANHLELGEHMLCSEYFPNSNLRMDDKLKDAMVRYYDFQVAYENVLRDGGEFNTVDVESVSGEYDFAAWPPAVGKINVLGRAMDDRQVIHLLNFANAVHVEPRDLTGTQTEPKLYRNMEVEITEAATVSKVWIATPDATGRMYEEVEFTQSGATVKLEVPTLKYWTMIVLEK